MGDGGAAQRVRRARRHWSECGHERRRDLAKQAKSEAEDAKVGIRNARKDANTEIKKLEKEGTSEDICKSAEDEVQNLTNSFIKKIDELLVIKDAEIMKV